MSKTGVLIPAPRVRQLVRLVGEVHEIVRQGRDPMQHAAQGISALIASDLGGVCTYPRFSQPDSNIAQMYFADGCPANLREELVELYQHEGGGNLDPFQSALFGRVRPGAFVVARREEVLN